MSSEKSLLQNRHSLVCIVSEDVIKRALSVAENARESAAELLAAHDSNLGRTTLKNRLLAEHLERVIAEAKTTVQELQQHLS